MGQKLKPAISWIPDSDPHYRRGFVGVNRVLWILGEDPLRIRTAPRTARVLRGAPATGRDGGSPGTADGVTSVGLVFTR